jgi:hypothetical protein
MRKLFLVSVLLPCVAVLAGCPKKKDDAPAAPDAEVAAVAPVVDAAPAAPVAKNAADIARFPAGEKAIADDDQKTFDLFTQVKTGPKQGANVALIKAGTDTFKIAEFQDCVLVTFADPKDATVTLMGWIPKNAYTKETIVDAGIKDAAKDAPVDAAPADAAPPPLKCAAGQEAVDNIGTTTVCRKKCSTDKDCKAPTAGACANVKTRSGKVASVCVNETP